MLHGFPKLVCYFFHHGYDFMPGSAKLHNACVVAKYAHLCQLP